VAVILAAGIRAPVIFSGSKSSASGRNAGGRLCTKLSTPSAKSGPLFSTSITAYERRQASSNEASRSASTWWRMAAMAAGEQLRARSLAYARAAGSTAPGSSTRFTSPSSLASSASKTRLDRSRSSALPTPT